MLERSIAKALRTRLDALGLLWRRVEWIGRSNAPDFVVMGPTEFAPDDHTVWVETKALGGHARESQEREFNRMREAGQIVLVINSLAEIDRWFPL